MKPSDKLPVDLCHNVPAVDSASRSAEVTTVEHLTAIGILIIHRALLMMKIRQVTSILPATEQASRDAVK